MENIKELLDKIDDVTNEVAGEIIKELKNNSKTYGEVIANLVNLKRHYMYLNKDKHDFLFSIIDDLLEKEMNDLPLTNRP